MFREIKANKISLAGRKPIYGIATNDANYMVRVVVDGRRVMCPYYQKWQDMLERCYSDKFHEKQPTYKNCSVCDDWLIFSNFKSWMQSQVWQGMDLDKDIKIKGNKHYSPDTCLFAPHALNNLLSDNAAIRGAYPTGVCYDKSRGRFLASISHNGKSKYLGRFSTPMEASKAYQQAKAEKIQQLIDDNTYPQATRYLRQHA